MTFHPDSFNMFQFHLIYRHAFQHFKSLALRVRNGNMYLYMCIKVRHSMRVRSIILRAGARCRRPPVGIPRVGAQTGWPEVVGKHLQSDGRKEGGGRRRKGGRNREEGGRRKEGGKKEGLSCGPWGPGGFLGSSRAVPGWSRVVLGGSRGPPWGPPGAVWEFLGHPQGVLGCLLGFGGARGAKTDDSEDLFLGFLAGRFAVERATSDKAGNSRTCLPGDQNGRFWGPLLGAPGRQVCCRKGNGRQSRKQ